MTIRESPPGMYGSRAVTLQVYGGPKEFILESCVWQGFGTGPASRSDRIQSGDPTRPVRVFPPMNPHEASG
jgi:hypothetical protein